MSLLLRGVLQNNLWSCRKMLRRITRWRQSPITMQPKSYSLEWGVCPPAAMGSCFLSGRSVQASPAHHRIASSPPCATPAASAGQERAFPRLRSPPAGMKQGCQACWLRTSSVLRSVLSLELKSSIFCWAGIFSSTCEYLQTQWIGRDTEAGLSD